MKKYLNLVWFAGMLLWFNHANAQLRLSMSSLSQVQCYEGSDGIVSLNATRGNKPYEYSKDNITYTSNPVFGGLHAGNYTFFVMDSKGRKDSVKVVITQPSRISYRDSAVSTLCPSDLNGAVYLLNVNGGTGTLNYEWRSSGYVSPFVTRNISQVKSGIYYLKIIDANLCEVKDTVIVKARYPISLKITADNITCNNKQDGKISVQVLETKNTTTASWTGPSSFSSSSLNILNLNQGTYSIKVTDDTTNCVVSSQVVIQRPPKLEVSLKTKRDVLCYGDSTGLIIPQVVGGTLPYIYEWTGPNSYTKSTETINDARKGTYTLLLTDIQGCTATLSTTLSEPNRLLVAPSLTPVSCYGFSDGAVSLTVNGGLKPYDFQWSNGATSQDILKVVAGDYEIVITDSNGCVTKNKYKVISPDPLEIDYTKSDVSCFGKNDGRFTLILSGGNFPLTNEITTPDNTVINTVNNRNMAPGTYKVQVSDVKNCRDSAEIKILEPKELSLSLDANNPACFGLKGSLGVGVSGGTTPFTFQWLDSTGSLYSATQNVVSADVGVYYLTVKDANFCSAEDSVRLKQPALLQLELTKLTNPSCALDSTGLIEVSTSGGTLPLKYRLGFGKQQTSNSFDKLPVGKYVVQVEDVVKCADTISIEIKNLDTLVPNVKVQNLTVYLDNFGNSRITSDNVDNGSTDNCGISSITLSQESFNCQGLGINKVLADVVDLSGNMVRDTAEITVLDTTKPVLRLQSAVIYLGDNGKVKLTASEVDNGSYDNCKLDSFTVSKSSFDCNNLGINKIGVTAKDASGNFIRDSILVNVMDTFSPTVEAKNISVYLNNTGKVQVTPNQLDNGSKDNCSIKSKVLSISNFDCLNLGNNFVNYTITDAYNNKATKLVRITVLDTISPVVKTKPITLYLNSFGFAVLKPEDIDDNSYDNCRIASMVIGQSVFTCVDLGEASTTLTLTDGSGNVSSGNVKVTVRDTLLPKVVTRNPTVYLDFNGNGVLSVFEVDKGSNDNCRLASININQDKFFCSDLGEKDLTFTAKDASGNSASGNFKVFVVDTMPPFTRVANKDIYLDQLGKATVGPNYFDAGTRDNCTLKSVSISKTDYDLNDIGNNIVLFSAVDQSSNRSVEVLNFKVLDTIAPDIYVPKQTRYIDNKGIARISVSEIMSGIKDNTSLKSVTLSDSVFECSQLGVLEVTVTATDIANNTSSRPFLIELLDSVKPRLVVKEAFIIIDTAGLARLKVSDVVDSVIENCELEKINLSKAIFNFSNEGDNFIEVQALDKSQNYSERYFVKVEVSLGDSDKDSLPDYIETGLDFDGDGVPNYLDKDSDNDGILDVVENLGLKVLLDLDQDGYPNIHDLDSDGDGIFDIIESDGFDVEPYDGRVGIGKVTVNFETGIPVLANEGLGQVPVDTDKDNIFDFLDLDSDDDQIADIIERGPSIVPRDFDNDKIPDYRDLDSDNDNISDLIETNADADLDNFPNYLDLDSDNDRIADAIELTDDIDGDGLGNWIDSDSDGDGILDLIETSDDFDEDGIGNWLDLDSDNDGIDDIIEGILNTDGDTNFDFLDLDSDNDAIPDSIEGKPVVNLAAVDTDGDGIPDYRDSDSDDDGLYDFDEGYNDTDGDGILDFRDLDSDNDGIDDQIEGLSDLDSDGLPNSIDRDSDGDGIWDSIETFVDRDGDRVPNCWDLDSDNDGINDLVECGYYDTSGTGLIRFVDTLQLADILKDIDGDGVPNFLDLDSDGDGIFDLVESGNASFDINMNGMVDGPDTDGDGIVNNVDGLSGAFGDLFDPPLQDYDYDGTYDFQDLDSDDDGISDFDETSNDQDFDGFGNYLDDDSDGDGIPDFIETIADFDQDGIPNYLDTDSDNDGIPDKIEAGSDPTKPVDTDGDGSPDYLDTDSDNDGVSDKEEGITDIDGNKVADYRDPQVFVPEIFTPNSDGVNDFLRLKGLNNYPNASLQLFNQWGQMVYDSKGTYKNDWNGQFSILDAGGSGVTLPEGVYFYILNYNQDSSSANLKTPVKGNIYIKP